MGKVEKEAHPSDLCVEWTRSYPSVELRRNTSRSLLQLIPSESEVGSSKDDAFLASSRAFKEQPFPQLSKCPHSPISMPPTPLSTHLPIRLSVHETVAKEGRYCWHVGARKRLASKGVPEIASISVPSLL